MFIKRVTFIVLLLVLVALSACTGMGGEPGVEPEVTGTTEPSETVEATPVSAEETPDAGDATPAAIEAALQRIAEELDMSGADLEVVTVTEKEWPNACLGLPTEDEMCAEVITPGYLVVIRADGRTFEVRTDSEGQTVRFEEVVELDTEAPQAVKAAIETVAVERGINASELEVVSFEEREWTDSCLGLGGPAELCAQVITPGWLVILEANGNTYEAHTDLSGKQVRLAETPGQSDAASSPVIVFNRSGGIAGEVVEWRIYQDGRVERTTGPEGGNQTMETSEIAPAVVDDMLNQLTIAGFFELSDVSLPENTCCDRFIYTLMARMGTESNTIQVIDGAEDVPEAAWESIQLVEEALTNSDLE